MYVMRIMMDLLQNGAYAEQNIYFFQYITKISRCVCETQTMPPAATKSKKAIFSAKVKVKVTRSLTLVSFERASLVEYACQI